MLQIRREQWRALLHFHNHLNLLFTRKVRVCCLGFRPVRALKRRQRIPRTIPLFSHPTSPQVCLLQGHQLHQRNIANTLLTFLQMNHPKASFRPSYRLWFPAVFPLSIPLVAHHLAHLWYRRSPQVLVWCLRCRHQEFIRLSHPYLILVLQHLSHPCNQHLSLPYLILVLHPLPHQCNHHWSRQSNIQLYRPCSQQVLLTLLSILRSQLLCLPEGP